MVEDSTLKRWFRLEAEKFNQGVVVLQRPLRELLEEESPAARTKCGMMHMFNKEKLTDFSSSLPTRLKERLRLPIFFHVDLSVDDSVYLSDRWGAETLQHLGEISGMHRFREGRLWLSKPIAYQIWNKWKGMFQFVVG